MIEEELPFGERTSQLLMITAKHPAISNPKYTSLLPQSWFTLSVLAQLSQPEFIKQINKGTIHPELQQKEAHGCAEWPFVFA